MPNFFFFSFFSFFLPNQDSPTGRATEFISLFLPVILELWGAPVKFLCKNCNLSFEADDAVICPRCSSKDLEKKLEKWRKETDAKRTDDGKKIVYSTNRIAYSDTKEGWKASLSYEMKACPECGQAEFDFNWKRREKTCKKCGSVFPLARRQA